MPAFAREEVSYGVGLDGSSSVKGYYGEERFTDNAEMRDFCNPVCQVVVLFNSTKSDRRQYIPIANLSSSANDVLCRLDISLFAKLEECCPATGN